MIKKILHFLILPLLFQSCTSDININDDWKEIIVLYGLLDQRDTTHYVRVQKAYLGEGDVYLMGQLSDSIYFSDSLYVELQAINNNGVEQGSPVVLEPHYLIKEEGVFATEGHYVFKTPDTFNQNLDQDLDYRVVVRNVNTSNEALAITPMIGDYRVIGPQTPTVNLEASSDFSMEWQAADNAGVYQPVLRFHYNEDGVDRYVDFEFGNVTNPNGASSLSKSIERKSIYGYIGSAIEPSLTKTRIPLGLEVIVYAAGEEFQLYSEINGPSSSIVEEKPEYTNVHNGLGLLSSRSSASSIEPGSVTVGGGFYEFTSQTLDSLKCGSKTVDLHFATLIVTPGSNGVDTVFCN